MKITCYWPLPQFTLLAFLPFAWFLALFISLYEKTKEVLSLSQLEPHWRLEGLVGIKFPSLWVLGGSEAKNLTLCAGDPGSIPGWGRCPGEGNGNPCKYSCLENSMDRGAWWAILHQGQKGRTQQSPPTHTHRLRIQTSDTVLLPKPGSVPHLHSVALSLEWISLPLFPSAEGGMPGSVWMPGDSFGCHS